MNCSAPGGRIAALDDQPHGRLGEIGRRGRGLGDDGQAGEDRRRELFQHAPDREIERVDLNRDAFAGNKDMLAHELSALGQELGVAVDQDMVVRQFAPALGGVDEQRPDAAVDVDAAVRERRAGVVGELVERLPVGVEVLGEGFQQIGALMEGERAQRRPADAPGVARHLADVEAVAGDQRDDPAVDRAGDFRKSARRFVPTILGIALQPHGALPRDGSWAASPRLLLID